MTTLLTLVVSTAKGDGAAQAPAIARIVETSEAYQSDVLRPLRYARNGLKAWVGGSWEEAVLTLRRELLEQELRAERLEQELVLDLLSKPQARTAPEDPLADVARTVALYLSVLGTEPDGELYQSLVQILTVALDDYDGLHVANILDMAIREQTAGGA